MDPKFTNVDLIFIYGNFTKHLKLIDKIKSSASCPFDEETINQEIAVYSSVTSKIEALFPEIEKMYKYL